MEISLILSIGVAIVVLVALAKTARVVPQREQFVGWNSSGDSFGNIRHALSQWC